MTAIRNLSIFSIIITLLFVTSSCRLAYICHAAKGQFQLIHNTIPIEAALEGTSLSPEEKERLRVVARVKDFGARVLGLKTTKNYQTIYLKSRQAPIYTVAASPKDCLRRITWWFPVAGEIPYLGFFDLRRAQAQKEKLMKKGFDVFIGIADAYSTLGWFRDPVTLNMLDKSIVYIAETILHEMTHTTLYVKGQGEFNEGLAVLVGKAGSVQFFEKTYGPSDPFTIEAHKVFEDECIFSAFLNSLMTELEQLYNSSLSSQEKLLKREQIFTNALNSFNNIRLKLQSDRFIPFGSIELNNAYLMSVSLYHRHFHLFHEIFKEKRNSLKEVIAFFHGLANEKGDMLQKTHARVHAGI